MSEWPKMFLYDNAGVALYRKQPGGFIHILTDYDKDASERTPIGTVENLKEFCRVFKLAYPEELDQ